METQDGEYLSYQSCWANFKCASDSVAQYKITQLSIEGGLHDVLSFYEVNTGNFDTISNNFGSLNTWMYLDDYNIWIDFRTDGSSEYEGFRVELRCIK